MPAIAGTIDRAEDFSGSMFLPAVLPAPVPYWWRLRREAARVVVLRL